MYWHCNIYLLSRSICQLTAHAFAFVGTSLPERRCCASTPTAVVNALFVVSITQTQFQCVVGMLTLLPTRHTQQRRSGGLRTPTRAERFLSSLSRMDSSLFLLTMAESKNIIFIHTY
jgi:hypothetical protein